MTFTRSLPSFLAFPIGGYLAVETLGSLDDALLAAAGTCSPARGRRRRPVARAALPRYRTPLDRLNRRAMAAGTPLATTVTGAGTDLQNLMVAGLVTGAAVGAAQSTLLSRGPRVSAAWTAVSAAGWSLGWLASWSIRGDVERGYSVFGASGALLVTVLTGLALRGWQPPRRPRASPRCRRRRRRDGGGPPARCALPSARAQAAGSPGLF